jgi:hypothetical protein
VICVDTSITYTFVEPLQLVQVAPKHGPMKGGEIVREKTNLALSGSSHCWFGEEKVTIESDGGMKGSVYPRHLAWQSTRLRQ